MLRIKETYGPTAILYQSDQHGENKVVHGPHGCGRKLLRLFGGYTLQVRNPDSWEGWWWGAKHVWGCEPVGQQVPQKNLLWDISKNAELLLFWGCDQETTTWGWQGQLPSRFSYWWTELGIRQIYIAPDCNYAERGARRQVDPHPPEHRRGPLSGHSPRMVQERHLRQGSISRPTPTAWTSSRTTSWAARTGEPKSPEWAAPITGVPARTIKALAAEWASKRTTVVIGNGGPGIRGPVRHRAGPSAGALSGHAGAGQAGLQPGQDDRVGAAPRRRASVALRRLRSSPACSPGTRAGTPGDTNPNFVPKSLVPKAILEGSVDWWGAEEEFAPRENQFVHYTYPAEGASRIHLIWTDSPSWITCWNDGNNFIRALRHPDIEFVFCQHPWLENDALFADLLLPANTKLEEDDIANDVFGGQMNLLFPETRCIEPLGESFSDYEIVCKIAERLGLFEEYTGGKTVPELIRSGYEKSGRGASHQLGGPEREGLLRGPAATRTGRRSRRA